MYGLAHMARINRPYRSQDEAQKRVGETFTLDGEIFTCTEFNDLGCLYWKAANGKLYVGGGLPV